MTTTTFHAPTTPAFLHPLWHGLRTAARFTGHFLLALLGVIFLGSGTEH